jgi:hypothetical protein
MAKNKMKVPKSLGGVRIPKSLRKSGLVNTFLNNDLGRKILADVIVAAAGAAAAAMARHRPSTRQVADTGEALLESSQGAASTTNDAVHTAAGTLGNVLTEAVRYVFPSDQTSMKAKRAHKRKLRELTVDHKPIKKTKNTAQASRRHH